SRAPGCGSKDQLRDVDPRPLVDAGCVTEEMDEHDAETVRQSEIGLVEQRTVVGMVPRVKQDLRVRRVDGTGFLLVQEPFADRTEGGEGRDFVQPYAEDGRVEPSRRGCHTRPVPGHGAAETPSPDTGERASPSSPPEASMAWGLSARV